MLDVGPTMHAILPEIEKVCSMLVEKKVSLWLLIHFAIHLFPIEHGRLLHMVSIVLKFVC